MQGQRERGRPLLRVCAVAAVLRGEGRGVVQLCEEGDSALAHARVASMQRNLPEDMDPCIDVLSFWILSLIRGFQI